MTAPAVSIILPTYNRAAVLGRAIRSVLAQTFSDFELLVIDDGSTDATQEIVSAIDDSRLRYLPQQTQNGPAVCRNLGIQRARAPLVAFQDSDDEWLIDKLARQIVTLHRAGEQTGLVCGGYLVQPIAAPVSYQGPDIRMQNDDWDAGNIFDFKFIAPTWLAKRDVLIAAGGFDETLENLEDWEFAFRLFQKTGIVAIDSPLLLKHGSADGLNAIKTSRIASLEKIITVHKTLWQRAPHTLARLHLALGQCQCLQGDTRAGRRNLLRASRLHPVVAKYWLHWALALAGHTIYARLITRNT